MSDNMYFGKYIIVSLLASILSFSLVTVSFAQEPSPGGNRWDTILDETREPIKSNIDGPVAEVWVGGVRNLFFKLIDRIAVPLSVFVAIFISILGLYKIMISEDEKSLQSVKWLITRGVIGIVLILSAKFIWFTFYNEILETWEISSDFKAVQVAGKLFDLILRPLLKLGFYIMMWVLFIILLLRVFTFVTASLEEVKKKAGQTIVATVVWLLVIMTAKQLVEWIYGKQDEVLAGDWSVSDVGTAIFSDINIPIIYTIIKRLMGLTWFIILLLIILYAYQILINPTNEWNIKRVRKYLLYSLLGLLVVGACYLIVNLLIIN